MSENTETEITEPTAAQAAAAESGVAELEPDIPAGMVAVPFRGQTLIVPGPQKTARSFRVRMALASNDVAKFLAGIVGEGGTAQIESLIDEENDDFDAVVTEFFEAYGKATGQGNS